MNKLNSIFLGLVIVFSALFVGPAALATTASTCESIGETVYKGDPRYLAKLDKDADGRICEKSTVQLPVNGTPIPEGAPSNQYGPASPTTGTSTGQVDANGNPVKLDSNGNPIKTDENGKPIQPDNLANTGATGLVVWGLIGGLALAAGIFFLRRAKTQ